MEERGVLGGGEGADNDKALSLWTRIADGQL